jgi:RHS repeat-associated protein
MLTLAIAKEEAFSAPLVWTDEGVLPLAATGAYPKTRVWGSKPQNVHCSDATAALKIELRWGSENSSEKTAVGSGVSFKYDPFGRRIYKSSSSGTSIFAYDGDNLVEETNSSGAAVARYADGTNVDEPLAELRSGTTSYYEADGLGSVTSLSNTAGALAQTYTFDSFGNQTASSGSLTNSFRFTGREFDTESMLYFMRARYFDPAGGRFISEDPIMFLGGYNFYSYVANAAPTYIDPFGLDKLCNIPAPAPPGPHHLVPTPITTCGTQPLIDCIIQAESSGNPKAKSNKGASGAMQVTPGVATELGKHGFDVGNMTNVQLGTTYINLLLTYCSNTAVALAAYNAGPGAVNSWGSIPEFPETHNYLKKINTCLQKKGLQQGLQDPGATSFCGCQQ